MPTRPWKGLVEEASTRANASGARNLHGLCNYATLVRVKHSRHRLQKWAQGRVCSQQCFMQEARRQQLA